MQQQILAQALSRGLQALRKNLLPGVLLWLLAIAIITGYHQWPVFRAFLDSVAQLKDRFGFGYSIASTLLFAAYLPLAIQSLFPSTRTRITRSDFAALTAYWGYRGFEIDLFYRIQAWLFGNDTELTTIVQKTSFDIFVVSPLWFIPFNVLFYMWKNAGYSLSQTRALLGPTPVVTWILPTLLMNSVIWLPGVTVVYLLPLPLQLPIMNIILCFWVLLLTVITRPSNAP